MKSFRRIVFALLAVLLAIATAPPASAENFVIHALGAETTAGTGSVAQNVGLSQNIAVVARVTAGSGTVGTFDVWLECSADGTNWSECAIDDRVKATTTGAGPHTDSTVKLVAETAVTTSAVYMARVTSLTQVVRARWNIAGTTPSETFEVVLIVK